MAILTANMTFPQSLANNRDVLSSCLITQTSPDDINGAKFIKLFICYCETSIVKQDDTVKGSMQITVWTLGVLKHCYELQ